MSKDTGGPAFPTKKRIYKAGYATADFEPISGMTLRDYFAAKALQSIMNSPDHVRASIQENNLDEERVGEYISFAAYDIADAMLKARKQ